MTLRIFEPEEQDLSRLSIEEILDDHVACVTWAQMARAIYRAVPCHQADRKQRILALMEGNADVYEAAQKCVAGRGHH